MFAGLQLSGQQQIQAQTSPNPCAPPVLNPIVCENSKPGNPESEWDISGAGDPSIQGFATDISVDQGQTVRFKIDTDATDYRLDIYRMGYYNGMGARKVATVQPSATLPQIQPECLTDSSTGLIDCGNWAQSASWTVPADATSGIYFAKLVREAGTSGTSGTASGGTPETDAAAGGAGATDAGGGSSGAGGASSGGASSGGAPSGGASSGGSAGSVSSRPLALPGTFDPGAQAPITSGSLTIKLGGFATQVPFCSGTSCIRGSFVH